MGLNNVDALELKAWIGLIFSDYEAIYAEIMAIATTTKKNALKEGSDNLMKLYGI